MENKIEQELKKLKKELMEKKAEFREIKDLLNEEIDREIPVSIEDLSERELESLLDEYHAQLARSANPLPEKIDVTSPRKIFRKPVIWIKRRLINVVNAYITPIMVSQTTFNRKCVELSQSLILQQKNLRKKINHIEERLKECESHLDIISKRLEELDAKNLLNE